MKKTLAPSDAVWFLGIEGGGTNTRVAMADAAGSGRTNFQLGPANLRLISNAQLVALFREIRARLPEPAAIGVGLPGARTESDRQRIRQAASRVWPGTPCKATNDLETALLAAARESPTRAARVPAARILVLSGTGSCCFGQGPEGAAAKVGGWGHLLGDKGSGYEVGLLGLRAVVHHYDATGTWPVLGEALLRVLQLNDPEALIDWAQQATKPDIAALARVVFAANQRRDQSARDIVDQAARSLVSDAITCARRLAKPRAPVDFFLAGGLLTGQAGFRRQVTSLLRRAWPGASVGLLRTDSVWGAVALARETYQSARSPQGSVSGKQGAPRKVARLQKPALFCPSLAGLADSPTEQRHPRSFHLDQLTLEEAIELMLREDARIPQALLRERDQIARIIRLIVRAFRAGGRLYYVGAGTSGRLGVLDASECPPTFQTQPELVQGIIAGGREALWNSVEGAEDNPQAGRQAVAFRGVRKRDVVVGIAASGRTPFVWGALQEAACRGAGTVLLCFNPDLRVPRAVRPGVILAPRIGPEILTGSTRLKAGTATKLVLNMFTTLAMVRWGKVMSNLMIDVKASNTKLRDRAIRIVQALTGAEPEPSRVALEKTRWDIRQAVRRLGQRRRTNHKANLARTG